jgi:hypothetical protein
MSDDLPGKPLTPVQRRAVKAVAEIATDPDGITLAFIHTVLCQAYLPYRDPGRHVREWTRTNGGISLMVQAGAAQRPDRGLVKVGLPFGPKPRLILGYLNAQALRQQSPVIDVGGSLTRFVRRLGLDTGGRTQNPVRDQLERLSAARVVLGMKSTTINTNIVDAFDLWSGEDGQRLLWPSVVRLSDGYFRSLMDHAVPLDERALAVLSHTAMGLDIYAWLAQRLHRVALGQDVLVPWPLLHDQFGAGYGRLRDFRAAFCVAARQVLAVYPDARVEIDGHGLVLRHSKPPVARLMVEMPALPSQPE